MAQEFADALRKIARERDQDGPQENRSEQASPKVEREPSSVAAALATLDLQPGASFEEASQAYKKLAAQNHPDKVAHMARAFRELAECKMRELNEAYERIRDYYQQR